VKTLPGAAGDTVAGRSGRYDCFVGAARLRAAVGNAILVANAPENKLENFIADRFDFKFEIFLLFHRFILLMFWISWPGKLVYLVYGSPQVLRIFLQAISVLLLRGAL
jgi:hypothetical protein